MKRTILILVGVIVALVLWDRFSSPKPVTQKSSNSASTNAAVAERISLRSRTAIGRPQGNSTNSESSDEDVFDRKKLSRDQIEAYLLKTKRSPESLLNAFIETGDTNFLAEAAKNFPENPIVQWTMLSKASPEERSQSLEKLKTSSPDNALPNYLSALDKFKAGNAEQALAEMDAASKKTTMSSFDKERSQSREEMYLLSGYSSIEAKEEGIKTITLDALSQMKKLAQEISGLQQKYKAAGDSSSAQELGAVGIEVGRRYADEKNSPYVLNQLVGYAMENIALKNLDSGTYYDFLGKTAGERFQEIKNQKDEFKDLARSLPLYQNLNDSEKMIYWDRFQLYGEASALRWLKKTYGGETK
ncbi:MAG: hypothetical protein ABIQ35_00275 [Verrucomicrobiota bacterium]